MSSTLSRSRSLRKPAGGELGPAKALESSPDRQSNVRTVSPSRLPLKGPSSSASTASRTTRATSTAASKSEDSGAPTSRSRPVSGIFGLGRSASVRQPAATNTTVSSTTASRPPITTRSRPPATRPTSSSGAPPTSSRPTTSSGLPSSASAAPSARGHARAKSSATALTNSTILRPPSQSLNTSSQPSVRPPATARLHGRQPSTSTAARPQSSTTPTPTTTGPAPALRKPAFTTLQQHFSPAKSLAPKPLTSTFLAPPSPSKLPTNVALSAETARLQTELLQLHLLHRDADGVAAGWHDSARRVLGEKFARLAAEEAEVRAEEARVWGDVNAAALRTWGGPNRSGGGRGDGLEEKVGLLDGVLATVWGLGEKGGKYSKVVGRFETWAEEARARVASRRSESLWRSGEVMFISDLDAGWKSDCEGLVRKLGECRDVMQVLGRAEGDSSLARVLAGVGALVEDMLAELDLMLVIERDAVRGENEWVRAVNGLGHDEDDTPRAGAIWRAFSYGRAG